MLQGQQVSSSYWANKASVLTKTTEATCPRKTEFSSVSIPLLQLVQQNTNVFIRFKHVDKQTSEMVKQPTLAEGKLSIQAEYKSLGDWG